MNILNNDVLFRIFLELDKHDIHNLSRMNKQLNQTIQEKIWKPLYEQIESNKSKPKDGNYLSLFHNKFLSDNEKTRRTQLISMYRDGLWSPSYGKHAEKIISYFPNDKRLNRLFILSLKVDNILFHSCDVSTVALFWFITSKVYSFLFSYLGYFGHFISSIPPVSFLHVIAVCFQRIEHLGKLVGIDLKSVLVITSIATLSLYALSVSIKYYIAKSCIEKERKYNEFFNHYKQSNTVKEVLQKYNPHLVNTLS